MDAPLSPLLTISNKFKAMYIDPKNKSLSWFDLGNHILIVGTVLLVILVSLNVE